METTEVLRLMTYSQAAKVLGVSERTVWALVDGGDLPAVRFGRNVRIHPEDLAAFIEQRRGPGAGT
jgi:excisionase family DNA binding protein